MPTYEYECKKCGHSFEEFQSMSDKPLKICPVCKKKGLQRLIGTGSAVIFKGSGFYETDYKSNSRGRDTGEKKNAEKEQAKEISSDKANGKESSSADPSDT